MIYFDHSATSSKKPACVIEAVSDYLSHSGNPDRGIYDVSLQASRMVLQTRQKVAQFFDVESFEKVIFTSGITESLNMIMQALFTKHDHVITTYLEHNSVLRPLYKQEVELSITDGTLMDIKKHLQPNTKAVICNHVSNVTGDIQDISRIGAFCQKHHLLFIVDCAQSAGIIPISMAKDNIDILCFTGHKALLGMQGIGGFCLANNVDLPTIKVGGSGIHSFSKTHPQAYPTRLEAGTLNVPGIISLYHGIDYLERIGLHHIYHKEQQLRAYFISRLQEIDEITIYQDDQKEHLGIVAFNMTGIEASVVSQQLATNYQIASRSGAHCAPLVHQHYHTKSMVRISFGYENTHEEIDICIEALKKIKEDYQ